MSSPFRTFVQTIIAETLRELAEAIMLNSESFEALLGRDLSSTARLDEKASALTKEFPGAALENARDIVGEFDALGIRTPEDFLRKAASFQSAVSKKRPSSLQDKRRG